MGGFYVNFHAHTDAAEQLRGSLQQLTSRAWVSQPKNRWISFFEESASSQDPRVIERIANQVSRDLRCRVISFLIHDDSVLYYVLYNQGEKEDEFDSCPDYFGGLEDEFDSAEAAEHYRQERQGKAEALLPLAQPGTRAEQVRAILDRMTSPFEQLTELAELLGIDTRLCVCDFGHIGRWQKAEDLGVTWLGPGAAPPPSPELEEFEKRQKAADEATQADPQLRFIHALQSGDEAEVTRFLDEGVDVNAHPSATPMLPLIAAVTSGRVQLVRLLLDRGADANRRGARGITALLMAAQMTTGESPQIVRALIDAGADASAADEGERTPLFCAVQSGLLDPSQAVETVRMLVSAGADPSQPSSNGQTPLGFISKLRRLSEMAGAVQGGGGSKSKKLLAGMRELEDALRGSDGN